MHQCCKAPNEDKCERQQTKFRDLRRAERPSIRLFTLPSNELDDNNNRSRFFKLLNSSVSKPVKVLSRRDRYSVTKIVSTQSLNNSNTKPPNLPSPFKFSKSLDSVPVMPLDSMSREAVKYTKVRSVAQIEGWQPRRNMPLTERCHFKNPIWKSSFDLVLIQME